MLPLPISFDLYVTIGSVILTLSMLPIVLNKKSRVPFWGAFPTAVVLFPYFAYGFAVVGAYVSASTMVFEGLLWWFVLFFRKIQKEKKPDLGAWDNRGTGKKVI